MVWLRSWTCDDPVCEALGYRGIVPYEDEILYSKKVYHKVNVKHFRQTKKEKKENVVIECEEIQ
jgi:hypothetical protein